MSEYGNIRTAGGTGGSTTDHLRNFILIFFNLLDKETTDRIRLKDGI